MKIEVNKNQIKEIKIITTTDREYVMLIRVLLNNGFDKEVSHLYTEIINDESLTELHREVYKNK